MSSAAALNRSYSCRRRTSSARGSSSSSLSPGGLGSNILDLISANVAAMTKYSPAQLEFHVVHEFDVARVLDGDLGNGNVENVQVLPPDEIQQQVQRPFEGLQEDLERVGRDVEIPGQFGNRFALDHRKGHLTLPGIARLA